MENWLACRALQACSVPRQMNQASQQVLCTYNASSPLHAAALPCCCRLQLAVQAHLRNVAGSTVHCHTPHSECISKRQAVCDQRACLVLLCCWCVCHRMLGCKNVFLGAGTAALDRLPAISAALPYLTRSTLVASPVLIALRSSRLASSCCNGKRSCQ